MSESRKGITSGAETANSVSCDSKNNRGTIRPAVNPSSDSMGTLGSEKPGVPIGSEDPRVP